jgi:catechol 2,3-dioxygenase
MANSSGQSIQKQTQNETFRLPNDTAIGYTHLLVPVLERSLVFYHELLGLTLDSQNNGTASLSASPSGPVLFRIDEQIAARPKPPSTTGLYHVAIRLPSRPALARLLARLLEQRYPLQGAADHLVSEALYLADPDGNGLELYVDRPRQDWPVVDGTVSMATDPLDVRGLLATAGDEAWKGIDPVTDIGHIHLQVSDLGRAEAFYCGILGFEVTQRNYPGALFVAAGGYHHHIGLNTWGTRGAPPPPPDAVGLIDFSIKVNDPALRLEIQRRLEYAGVPVERTDGSAKSPLRVHDPDGNGIVI